MKDKKMTKLEKIKEYDKTMEVLYYALEKAIENPAQKHRQLNIPYNICKYRETIKFIKENYPNYYHNQYDLSLLNKKEEALSKDDLIAWQLEVAIARGSLSGIEEKIGN